MRSTHATSPAAAAVTALMLLLASCGGADVAAPVEDPAQKQEQATGEQQVIDGWVEVRPEPNLSLQLRDGWNANRVENGKGPIVFTGPSGARAVVWPMFIASSASMPAPSAILTSFAKADGPTINWGKPSPLGANAVRMFGEAGDTVAQATFVYTQSEVGMVGYWYLSSAPRDQYEALQPVFSGLMKGVRIYGSADAGQAAAAPKMSFVDWKEPNEGAYVAQAPKGWRVKGGITRPSPLRLLDAVEMTSPDEKVYAFSGDPTLPLFKTITQMERQLGMVEGSRNGEAILLSYQTAEQFLPDYLQRRFRGRCGSLKIASLTNQADLAATANAALAASTAPGAFQRADVALATFSCGSDLVGAVQMATYIGGSLPQFGVEGFGLWQVSGVAGFIAPKDRAAEGAEAIIAMLTSRKVDPKWARGNQEMVAQVNAISRDAANKLSAQIASWSPSPSPTSTGSSSDDLSRRWQNSTMDQTDVVDQATGKSYKVDSGASYYWIDPQGAAIVGTNSPAQPTVDFSLMTQLP